MARQMLLSWARILDVSMAHSGPFGSQLLADLGAEVLKIESPTGDHVRNLAPKLKGESYYYLALNRNKRDITLDLSTETGLEAFRDLVRVSHVVYDNYRPGVAKRLGIEYETLRKINPGIISVSISGFGDSGPYCNYPSYDDIAQGITGMYSLCGEPGGKPMRSPIAIADISGGIFAAMGTIAALCEWVRTGTGRKVEVNLLDGCLYLLASHLQYYFVTGEVPRAQGSRHATLPLLGIFKTRDSYIVLGPSWPRIARALGLEWMIDDPRFNSVEKRHENRKLLEDLVEEALSKADTAEWVDLMRTEDIAAAPVNNLEQALCDPQTIHNNRLICTNHLLCGEVKGIECPVRFKGDISEEEHSSAPVLGQHTEEVLTSILAYSPEKIRKLKEEEKEHLAELRTHTMRRL